MTPAVAADATRIACARLSRGRRRIDIVSSKRNGLRLVSPLLRFEENEMVNDLGKALASLSVVVLLAPACNPTATGPGDETRQADNADPKRIIHWPIWPLPGTTYTTFYASDDGMIFARDQGASGWRTWYNFSGLGWDVISYPAAASWGSGRIDVFNITRSNNTILHTFASSPDGTVSMDNWGSAPGYTFFGKPDASSWGDQRIDIFAPARDGNGNTVIQHKGWDHGRVYGWESYGAAPNGWQFVGPLTATSWGTGRIDLFAVASDAGNGLHLVHAWTNTGAPPSSWEEWGLPAGAVLTDNSNGIDVASWGANRLDLFVLDSSSRIRHMWWDNGATAWDDWTNGYAGSALGRVSAVSTESGTVIVSAQDSSGPQVWEHPWISGDQGWRDTGLAPEANVQFVSGGFDISHW
jgi:hypothetical protein